MKVLHHILVQNRKEMVMNNKKIISIIIGIMCIVLSYGIAAQIKATENRGISTSTNTNENELRDEVLRAKEKYA